MTLRALLAPAPPTNFSDARAIRGDISETSTPVPPDRVFPELRAPL